MQAQLSAPQHEEGRADEPEYVGAEWLMTRYDISESCVYKWVRNKILPPPVRLGPNTSRWKRSTLMDWEVSREARA